MESFPNGRTLQVNESLFLFQHIIPICLRDVSPSLPYALVWWHWSWSHSCTPPNQHEIPRRPIKGWWSVMHGRRSQLASPLIWTKAGCGTDEQRHEVFNRTAIAMGFLCKMILHVHFTDICVWFLAWTVLGLTTSDHFSGQAKNNTSKNNGYLPTATIKVSESKIQEVPVFVEWQRRLINC